MRDHLSIRRLTEADLDVAADILAAAYDNPASSRSASLRRYLSMQPDGWLLATLDGRAVGIGGAVNYGPFASIGSVGVRPEAQRRGVARALMERLLAWLEAADCQVVVLVATDAGAPLYQALGFVEDGATLVFRRTATLPPPEPPPMAPRVSPLRADDLPALVRFDAPIFGASRPSVLAGYHADDPARLHSARRGGRGRRLPVRAGADSGTVGGAHAGGRRGATVARPRAPLRRGGARRRAVPERGGRAPAAAP